MQWNTIWLQKMKYISKLVELETIISGDVTLTWKHNITCSLLAMELKLKSL